MTSTFFQICSIFYVILLMYEYFSKKRIKNIENKIYTCLIVNVIIELILDVASIITIRHKDEIPILNLIVAKSYLAALISWMSFFTLYILMLANKHTKKEVSQEDLAKKNKKISYSFRYCICYLYCFTCHFRIKIC